MAVIKTRAVAEPAVPVWEENHVSVCGAAEHRISGLRRGVMKRGELGTHCMGVANTAIPESSAPALRSDNATTQCLGCASAHQGTDSIKRLSCGPETASTPGLWGGRISLLKPICLRR